MTWDERVKAIADHGFTERQAGFLVTVMLHSGVCLGRHYSAFARITHGQKVQDFFRKVVARKYATARRCGHNRARLYHFHHKPMYEAIGEPDNRHRRPLPLSRAVERLMVLDAVLGQRDLQWLATEREKVAYFTTVQRVPLADLPSLTFSSDAGQTVRRFTDKLPIGIGDDGRTYVFLYLVTRPLPADFRMFLERHAELWRALPAWSVRLLIPHHLSNSMNRYQEAFREQVGSPLRPTQLQELRWFFEARRSGSSKREDGQFDRAKRAFGTPAVSGSLPRLDRAGRPRAGRGRLAHFGDCDRASDRQIRSTRTGASVSPSRSSGRHGVISVTRVRGGGGRGDDVRGTISPLQEAE